jgi:hypothetical protein
VREEYADLDEYQLVKRKTPEKKAVLTGKRNPAKNITEVKLVNRQ